jgi:hypothetical protein
LGTPPRDETEESRIVKKYHRAGLRALRRTEELVGRMHEAGLPTVRDEVGGHYTQFCGVFLRPSFCALTILPRFCSSVAGNSSPPWSPSLLLGTQQFYVFFSNHPGEKGASVGGQFDQWSDPDQRVILATHMGGGAAPPSRFSPSFLTTVSTGPRAWCPSMSFRLSTKNLRLSIFNRRRGRSGSGS